MRVGSWYCEQLHSRGWSLAQVHRLENIEAAVHSRSSRSLSSIQQVVAANNLKHAPDGSGHVKDCARSLPVSQPLHIWGTWVDLFGTSAPQYTLWTRLGINESEAPARLGVFWSNTRSSLIRMHSGRNGKTASMRQRRIWFAPAEHSDSATASVSKGPKGSLLPHPAPCAEQSSFPNLQPPAHRSRTPRLLQ
jgi:hypothetical protein